MNRLRPVDCLRRFASAVPVRSQYGYLIPRGQCLANHSFPLLSTHLPLFPPPLPPSSPFLLPSPLGVTIVLYSCRITHCHPMHHRSRYTADDAKDVARVRTWCKVIVAKKGRCYRHMTSLFIRFIPSRNLRDRHFFPLNRYAPGIYVCKSYVGDRREREKTSLQKKDAMLVRTCCDHLA